MAVPARSSPTKKKSHRGEPHADARRKGRAPARAAAKTHGKKTARAAQKPSRREVGQQLSQELLKLRPVLRDVGSALLGRLDGELAGLAASLGGESLHGDVPALPEVAVLFAMLADIQALKMKPKKGRLKDLRRVEALLESLSARIPPEA